MCCVVKWDRVGFHVIYSPDVGWDIIGWSGQGGVMGRGEGGGWVVWGKVGEAFSYTVRLRNWKVVQVLALLSFFYLDCRSCLSFVLIKRFVFTVQVILLLWQDLVQSQLKQCLTILHHIVIVYPILVCLFHHHHLSNQHRWIILSTPG